MPVPQGALKITQWVIAFLKITACKVLCWGDWLLKLDSLECVCVCVCVCVGVFVCVREFYTHFPEEETHSLRLFVLWFVLSLLGIPEM